jgi:hypothetical protein
MGYHTKQAYQERQNYREFLKKLDQTNHQSFSCLILDFLESLENSQLRMALFQSHLYLHSCVLGLTKCPFVLCAHFARLRSIATKVVQDVPMRAVELVLYSTQYPCMVITRVAFLRASVTALELHYT